MCALAICAPTPLPQSMRYVVPLTMIAWAGAERLGFGVGPPPVPSRISREVRVAWPVGSALESNPD
jgi:hypothetical protein